MESDVQHVEPRPSEQRSGTVNMLPLFELLLFLGDQHLSTRPPFGKTHQPYQKHHNYKWNTVVFSDFKSGN
eukprot:m.148670 g.148670  ORF g.148670 m.148670 type:complete len:71 (+) comp30612_c0_seq1:722-934(+)